MIGVADFVVDYPKEGAGCFGLLLISEKFHNKGFGGKSVELIEDWAYKHHRIKEITLGIELINRKGYNFWIKHGYKPTGEIFSNEVMDIQNEAELFVKIKDS